MVEHQHPRMYLQTLILLAKTETIHQDIAVKITRKYVHPIYYSICYEVDTLRVAKFILAAHAVLFTQKSYANL
jgi:hypothetical protein